MSARERFFLKVQHKNDRVTSGKKSADAEVRAFCSRMDELAQQINPWFAGSGIETSVSERKENVIMTEELFFEAVDRLA